MYLELEHVIEYVEGLELIAQCPFPTRKHLHMLISGGDFCWKPLVCVINIVA